jgi:hypothetical protein
MAFLINGVAGVNLTDTYASAADTTAGAKVLPMAVGTVAQGNDGSKWMLVKATSTIAQYDACIVINTSSATGASIGCVPVTTTNAATGQRFAVAQNAIASSLYGWVALEGHDLRVKTLIACQPAVPLYTTATAGSLDDAIVTAGYCLGVVLMSSATSASAPPVVVANAVIRTWGGG